MNSQTLSANNGHHATSNGHRPSQSTGAPATTARPSVIQMLREADAAERSQLPPALGFSPQQIAALSAPLNRAHLSSREQGRGSVSYLKSWVVLNEANRIFGFDGWQRQTLSCHCVSQAERLIGENKRPGWGVTYIARVRITVAAGAQGSLIREGTGAGHGIDTDLGLAHESAIKEAETDATKRALVTFGNPFGLALYDKSQRQVSGAAPEQGQSEPRAGQTRAMQARGGQSQPASPAPRPTPQPESQPSDPSSAATPPRNGLSPAPAMGLNARSPSRRANSRPKPASGQRLHLRLLCGAPPKGATPSPLLSTARPEATGSQAATRPPRGLSPQPAQLSPPMRPWIALPSPPCWSNSKLSPQGTKTLLRGPSAPLFRSRKTHPRWLP